MSVYVSECVIHVEMCINDCTGVSASCVYIYECAYEYVCMSVSACLGVCVYVLECA